MNGANTGITIRSFDTDLIQKLTHQRNDLNNPNQSWQNMQLNQYPNVTFTCDASTALYANANSILSTSTGNKIK